MLYVFITNICIIKTHSCVFAAKKDVRHTSVLFTENANLPFSIPHISITSKVISIKILVFFTLHMKTQHIKCEEHWLSSSQDIRS